VSRRQFEFLLLDCLDLFLRDNCEDKLPGICRTHRDGEWDGFSRQVLEGSGPYVRLLGMRCTFLR